MQFKFGSKLKIGGVEISLENLNADHTIVTDLRGNEYKCAQCMRKFEEGDNVLVVQDTIYTGNTVTLDGSLQLVHIGAAEGNEGRTCAEDYLSRIINKHIPPVPAEIIPNVEEPTKEGDQTQ